MSKDITFPQVDEKKPGKFYLQLLHGRKTPDEKLEDWGFDGPALGPIEWVHVTYNTSINIKFSEYEEATEPCVTEDEGICFVEDLLYYGGNYYGDWEFVLEPETTAPKALSPTTYFLCPNCYSTDVFQNATTSWDVETQQWLVNDSYSHSICCNACNAVNVDPVEHQVGSPIEPLVLDWDDFVRGFKPQTNHLDDNASYDGFMYQIHGGELDFVKEQDPYTVWTVITNDNNEEAIVSGWHFVNRLGYLVTEKPYLFDIYVHDN